LKHGRAAEGIVSGMPGFFVVMQRAEEGGVYGDP
jgi:hypothetical protein